MRTLIVIPIIHTEQDMGSLLEQTKQTYVTRYGQVKWTEAVTRSLSALYTKLETGAITEEEFEIEEKQLLDRLDIIDLRNQDPNVKSDAGTDDEFDEDETDERDRLTPPETD